MATEESNAPGLFPSIWRFRWTSLLIVLVAGVLFGAGGYVLAPQITATSSVSLKNPSSTNVLAPGVTSDAATTRYIQQRADFFTSDQVLQRVADEESGLTVTELRGRIDASATTGSNVVTVTATGSTAAQAAALSRATVAAYRAVSQTALTSATDAAVKEIEANEADVRHSQQTGALGNTAASTTLAALQQQVNGLRTDSAVFADGVDFVQAATAESATVPGVPVRDIGLGLIIGLVIAAIVAWLRADRHRRITRPSRAEGVLGAPLLGVAAPAKRSRAAAGTLTRPTSHASGLSIDQLPAPEYGLAAAAVQRVEGSGVVVVLGAPGAAERSDVVLNIAMLVAGTGDRVLLVDADPDGALSKRLGAGALEGFPALTAGDDGDRFGPEIVRLQASDDIEFGLVTPGARSGGESLTAVREFVADLLSSKDDYDLIIVDAPPVESSTFVPALIRASAALLVTVPSGADESAVADIRRTAEVFSTPIIGYVYTSGR